MHTIRTLAAAVLLFTVTAPPALAQEERSRFGFGGTAGLGETWDDEGSIGSGWLAGGYVDWRLFGKTDLQIGLDVLRHERTETPFNAFGHTTFLSASLLRRFGSDRTNGYLLGGYAITRHEGEAGFPAEGRMNRHESTDHGWIVGGGLAFRAGRRVEIGPVFRIALIAIETDSDPAIAMMTGIRVGIRR